MLRFLSFSSVNPGFMENRFSWMLSWKMYILVLIYDEWYSHYPCNKLDAFSKTGQDLKKKKVNIWYSHGYPGIKASQSNRGNGVTEQPSRQINCFLEIFHKTNGQNLRFQIIAFTGIKIFWKQNKRGKKSSICSEFPITCFFAWQKQL